MKLVKTRFYSYKTGNLANGCKYCVRGEKSVLFITGICGSKCYYCPISDKKYGQDVIYINEMPIKEKQTRDLIKEIELCSSKGVGITGGDPLTRMKRTIKWIKLLKNRFGRFHIHLYTPLNLVTEENLKKLYDAGLDEIRFHPNIEDKKLWKRIESAKEFPWKIGVEIPVIPGKKKETIKLINYLKSIKIDFLNLNELEMADNKASRLLEKGFKVKNNLSYGVKGSEELALELLKYCSKINLGCHYCTSTLKDKVQMAKRIKKRAENIAQKFDRIDKDGMLVRGAIYLNEFLPGFKYREKIEALSKNKAKKERILAKLVCLRILLIKKNKIPLSLIEIDDKKFRVLTSAEIIKTLPKNLNISYAIVKEYPTHDLFEIEINFKKWK